jgi:hypothetical protein
VAGPGNFLENIFGAGKIFEKNLCGLDEFFLLRVLEFVKTNLKRCE